MAPEAPRLCDLMARSVISASAKHQLKRNCQASSKTEPRPSPGAEATGQRTLSAAASTRRHKGRRRSPLSHEENRFKLEPTGKQNLSKPKPDLSAEIPADTLATARAWIRQTLERSYLPSLPDLIQETLFLQGRSAWTFRYTEPKITSNQASWRLQYEVTAKLKKAFHSLMQIRQLGFAVAVIIDKAKGIPEIVSLQPIEPSESDL